MSGFCSKSSMNKKIDMMAGSGCSMANPPFLSVDGDSELKVCGRGNKVMSCALILAKRLPYSLKIQF